MSETASEPDLLGTQMTAPWSPANGVRERKTHGTATRVATRQVPRLETTRGRVQLGLSTNPAQSNWAAASFSSPSTPWELFHWSLLRRREQQLGATDRRSSAAQDAQNAETAIFSADRKPNPPILMGNVANVFASVTCASRESLPHRVACPCRGQRHTPQNSWVTWFSENGGIGVPRTAEGLATRTVSRGSKGSRPRDAFPPPTVCHSLP